MKEQLNLCEQCQPTGKCFLKELVDSVVKNIPPVEKQTRLVGTTTVEVVEAEIKIASYTKEAREKLGCPNINSIKPIIQELYCLK